MVKTTHASAAESENKLLKRLLGLPRVSAPETELAAAIRLLAEATQATSAYFEVASLEEPDDRVDGGHEVGSEEDGGSTICRGAIARSIVERSSIESASARFDPRFSELGSVRRNEIDALVCVPIEAGGGVGAVCVQRCAKPGAFSKAEVQLVELFAQQLAHVADRLTGPAPLRVQIRRVQETLVRDALSRSKGNVARAARELQVARSFVYSVVTTVERPPRERDRWRTFA